MISQFYKIALAALLGYSLAGCGGGGSQAPAPQESRATAPRSLHTGRTLMIGGNELFDRDPVTLRLVARDYGPCVDNEGVSGGDSSSFMNADVLDALNEYPGRVVIVASAFELTYAERWRTLDNITTAVMSPTVTGSKVTLVGVPGAVEFNAELRNITRAYGATFAETLPEPTCD